VNDQVSHPYKFHLTLNFNNSNPLFSK
jgi:hypothetical protein